MFIHIYTINKLLQYINYTYIKYLSIYLISNSNSNSSNCNSRSSSNGIGINNSRRRYYESSINSSSVVSVVVPT